MAGLIERFQSMRNAIFLLICWELDRIRFASKKPPSILEFACVVRFNGMNDGFA
ncbi:hypothetical protein ACE6H2_006708 [Prunus campanulata]